MHCSFKTASSFSDLLFIAWYRKIFLCLAFAVCRITSVYRKPTHTGQYSHISSFTPWSRKIAWIRALVNRAYKICSNATLLNNELKQIQNFMSWNGFPRKLTSKLIKLTMHFKPSPPVSNDNDATMTETNKATNIWLQLPYLGKLIWWKTNSFVDTQNNPSPHVKMPIHY
jgi:hypothetical protein